MKKMLFLFLPFLFTAQTHRFIYEYQFKTDSTAQDFQSAKMVLDITKTEVKFFPYMQIENDSISKNRGYISTSWNFALPTLSRKLNSFDNVSYYYMSSYFKMESKDEMIWKLENETKKVGKFNLQKAITNFGGRKWTAWFDPEIPFSEGPFKFRGLPGLIFEIEDENQFFKFSLIKSERVKENYKVPQFTESFTLNNLYPISIELYNKKKMENYEDPLRQMREGFMESQNNPNIKNSYEISGVKITSVEQFKPMKADFQKRYRKFNNDIERKFILKYPE